MHYLHTDHLGSLNVLTNESGTIEQEISFDAWGNRRDPATLQNYTTAPTGLITDRGFTGHEHMEAFKLINMNGRIYDPLLGRFLSADKVVANAASTQDYNRFSYCINNPLSYTDPTGWSFAYGHKIWYPWENSGDSSFPDENGGGSGNGFNNNSVLPQWYINRENHNESKLNESTTWYSSLLDLLNTYSDVNFTAITHNNTSGLNFNAYDNLNHIDQGTFYTFHEAFNAYLLIIVLQGFNIGTLLVIVNYFAKITFAKNAHVYQGLSLAFVLLVINYFTLYSKREEIFKKYENLVPKRKTQGLFYFWLYVLLSTIIFFVAVANLVTPKY